MKTRKWLIISMVLVLGVTAGFAWMHFKKSSTSEATAPAKATVQSVAVQRGPIAEMVSAIGNLKPLTRFDVKSSVGGEIQSIAVREGDFVEADGVIAKLDTSDLELKVKQATANYLSAKANVNKLTSGPTDLELVQVETALRQAELAWKNAQDDLGRYQKLYNGGGLSKQQFEEYRTKAVNTEQQYIAAKQKVSDLKAGASAEDLEVAKAQLAQAEANLAIAQAQLEDAVIRSPIAGTVATIPVQEHEMINNGTVMVSVLDLRSMEVVVPVNEIDIPKIKVGQQVVVTVDALPGTTLHGQVVNVATESAVKDNIVTFEVTARLQNEGDLLKPGMTADMNIILGRKDDALLVPVEAVTERAGRAFVTVVDGETQTPKPVTIGLRTDQFLEVREGLDEGDQVAVTAGTFDPQQMTNFRFGGGMFPGVRAGGFEGRGGASRRP